MITTGGTRLIQHLRGIHTVLTDTTLDPAYRRLVMALPARSRSGNSPV
jgi:hypothetical protein